MVGVTNATNAWQRYYEEIQRTALSLVDPATGLLDKRYGQDVPCPGCGSSSVVHRLTKNGFTYVTCSVCGMVYISPQLNEETIRKVYNDDKLRLLFFKEWLLPYGEQEQKGIFAQRAAALWKFVRCEHPRLLDVGCALGNFMLIAGQVGFETEGLELNEFYVEYIREHRAINVHQKTLEAMHYPEHTFDAVTLWDVLEHLPKPKDTLSEIARITKPNAIVALTTINHGCFNEKLLKEEWRYYQPPDHLCSFTPALLRTMLQRSGFSVVAMEHHYMFEVLADVYFQFLKLSDSTSTAARMTNKLKKVICFVLRVASESLFNTLQSGDLLTVYAIRKA